MKRGKLKVGKKGTGLRIQYGPGPVPKRLASPGNRGRKPPETAKKGDVNQLCHTAGGGKAGGGEHAVF